jgi:uncharacterized membrane protein YphA (DoxX/SURF4 family)
LLLRLFHEFPRGRSGAGLLLLRTAVALAILVQAAPLVLADLDQSRGSWIRAVLDVLAAGLLLAGFLTPIAAGVAALEAIGVWTAVLPPYPDFPHSRLLAAFLTVLQSAVALLGPGAFSVDARLFGLREIIIPRGRSDA